MSLGSTRQSLHPPEGTPVILVGLLAAALALSLVALLLGQTLGRRTGWVIAAGLALLGIVLAGIAWSTPGLRADVPWLPSLGVALRLRLDGLAVVFALVVLGIGALVMAYAVSYLPDGRHGSFYGLLTFFAAAMLGLVLSDDLVLTWVMWEFTTLTPEFQVWGTPSHCVTGGFVCLLGGVSCRSFVGGGVGSGGDRAGVEGPGRGVVGLHGGVLPGRAGPSPAPAGRFARQVGRVAGR